jgi:TetR/AcrR family transcriptional repressor of nem operon
MGRTSDARERLVDEASQLFHARSYESVGVQELCEAASINKGSFYHFFASKEDLAAAVIEAQWQTTLDEILDPALADDVPPLARIERLFVRMTKQQREARRELGRTPGCPLANMSGEVCGHEPKLRRRLIRVYDSLDERIREVLREAVKVGELPRGTNVEAKAEAIVALAEGAMLLSAIHDDPATANRLGKLVLALAHAPEA